MLYDTVGLKFHILTEVFNLKNKQHYTGSLFFTKRHTLMP